MVDVAGDAEVTDVNGADVVTADPAPCHPGPYSTSSSSAEGRRGSYAGVGLEDFNQPEMPVTLRADAVRHPHGDIHEPRLGKIVNENGLWMGKYLTPGTHRGHGPRGCSDPE